MGALAGGITLALLVFFFMEWVIVVVESVAFAKLLKEHIVGRRVVYAIVANLFNFIAGLLVVLASVLG